MRRLDNMDLRLLRIFATLVEAGSFSEAQVALNITQPTLSTHLSTLEHRLGQRLCERGRKGFRLTPFGSKTYEAAKQLFADIDGFNQRIGQQAPAQERIRLGIIDGVVTNPALGLQFAIDTFVSQHREILVSLELGTPDELNEAMQSGNLDVMVGPFVSKQAGVVYTPIHRELHSLYCGRNHPLFQVDNSRITRKMIDESLFSVRGYKKLDDLYRVGHPRASGKVNRIEAQTMLILSGHYIGFLPCHAAEAWVEKQQMWPLKHSAYCFYSQHYVAYQEKEYDNPLVAAFVAAVKQRASRARE